MSRWLAEKCSRAMRHECLIYSTDARDILAWHCRFRIQGLAALHYPPHISPTLSGIHGHQETLSPAKDLPEVNRLEPDRAVPHAREPTSRGRLASGCALVPAASLLGEVAEGIGAAGGEGGSCSSLLEDDRPGGAEECGRRHCCFFSVYSPRSKPIDCRN